MSKVLRWIGVVVGALVILGIVAAGVYLASEGRLNKAYDIAVEAVAVPEGPEAVQRGEHLARAVGACVGCHGEDLEGGPVIEDPAIGVVYALNLTPGQGGIGGQFSDADYVRAIRHGVRPDGKPMWIMPSEHFYNFNDADLGALIAYLESLPPVDNETKPLSLGPVGRVLFATGQLPLLPAEAIDHAAARPAEPPAGVTVEYGEYLVRASGCNGCHGPDLSGGAIPGGPPGGVPASNLTPGGEMGAWTEADFIETLRTGVAPSGHELVGDMPWREYGQMSDDELKAIWMYLQTVPAKS